VCVAAQCIRSLRASHLTNRQNGRIPRQRRCKIGLTDALARSNDPATYSQKVAEWVPRQDATLRARSALQLARSPVFLGFQTTACHFSTLARWGRSVRIRYTVMLFWLRANTWLGMTGQRRCQRSGRRPDFYIFYIFYRGVWRAFASRQPTARSLPQR
jgi:hypothetical protein